MKKFDSTTDFIDQLGEERVLSAVRVDPALYWRLRDELTADSFAVDPDTWTAIEKAIESESELPNVPESDSAVDLDATVFRLADLANRRKVARLLDDTAKHLHNPSGSTSAHDLATTLSEEGATIASGLQTSDAGKLLWGRDLIPGVLDTVAQRYERRKEKGRAVVGMRTGLTSLDARLNGLNQGLYVLGGGPGAGKTALAFQVAEAVSNTEHVPVVYVTFENSPANLIERRLSALAGHSISDVTRGQVEPDELQESAGQLADSLERVGIIEGTSRLTVSDIRARARQMMNRFDASQCLVIVDYVQLWAKASKELDGRRDVRERVEVLANALRELANTLRSPLLLLSSLNRAAGNYGSGFSGDNDGSSGKGRATLDALKETGDLEYAADVVMLINPGDYSITPPAIPKEITVAKNRHGETGRLWMTFHAHRCEFREPTDRSMEMVA